MTASEKIQQIVEDLPPPYQEHLLRYARFLVQEAKRAAADADSNAIENSDATENREWSALSVANALRDLEEDEFPDYSEAEIKEKY
jgi:hypothetical protein